VKDAITRDDPPKHDNLKTYDRAFAETKIYLNGLSQLSAFKRDYVNDTIRELGNVQSKYASETVPARIRSRRSPRTTEYLRDVASPPPPTADDVGSMPTIPAEHRSRALVAGSTVGTLLTYCTVLI
jgi:hypothetical protein